MNPFVCLRCLCFLIMFCIVFVIFFFFFSFAIVFDSLARRTPMNPFFACVWRCVGVCVCVFFFHVCVFFRL